MKEIAYTAQLSGSLLLNSEGVWFHNGTPFANPKLIELFLRSIVWDAAQQAYFVEIGNQRATFSHEGYVYFATSLDDSTLPWQALLSSGTQVVIDPSTLAIDSTGAAFFLIEGMHKVKMLRSAHQILARHVIDDDAIDIGGHHYTLKRESP